MDHQLITTTTIITPSSLNRRLRKHGTTFHCAHLFSLYPALQYGQKKYFSFFAFLMPTWSGFAASVVAWIILRKAET